MTRLPEAEIQSYRARGFVIPRYRVPEPDLTVLRQALDRVIVDNPDIRPERLVSVHIEGRNSEGVRGRSEFLALARAPAILDMVEQVIGPDIILWGCQVFCKPATDGMEVPWHQDGHYWPIRPLATCTVWVALDDSTVENGCMRVIPGSHRGRRLYEHFRDDRDGLTLNRAIAAGQFDERTAADVALRAGEMSLHDIYLIHGSRPNRSTRRRAGVAIRYLPATSHFDRQRYATSDSSGYTVDFAGRPLWLVRGVDRAGNDFEIGHRRAAG
jgi:ectoine hydroxylase-related dioxygenase (phytanoyl-CoA dioxygenase family)